MNEHSPMHVLDSPMDVLDYVRAFVQREADRRSRLAPCVVSIRVDGTEVLNLVRSKQSIALQPSATVVELVGRDDEGEVVIAVYLLTYDRPKTESWKVSLPWCEEMICTFRYGADDDVDAEIETKGAFDVTKGGDSRVDHTAALALRSSLFFGASLAACREIVSLAHEKKFESAQVIFCQGDSVRQVLLLISGCVKLLQVSANGHEVMLRLSGPGELIGVAASHIRNRNSTARAQQPCTALAWDISTFETIFERYTFLRRNMLNMHLQYLEDMHERFREISTQRVAARLSSQILRMMHQVGRQVDGGIEISISHEELAQLIGTTLFTVSRLLSDWDRQGIVAARREAVSVRNLPALVDLSNA